MSFLSTPFANASVCERALRLTAHSIASLIPGWPRITASQILRRATSLPEAKALFYARSPEAGILVLKQGVYSIHPYWDPETGQYCPHRKVINSLIGAVAIERELWRGFGWREHRLDSSKPGTPQLIEIIRRAMTSPDPITREIHGSVTSLFSSAKALPPFQLSRHRFIPRAVAALTLLSAGFSPHVRVGGHSPYTGKPVGIIPGLYYAPHNEAIRRFSADGLNSEAHRRFVLTVEIANQGRSSENRSGGFSSERVQLLIAPPPDSGNRSPLLFPATRALHTVERASAYEQFLRNPIRVRAFFEELSKAPLTWRGEWYGAEPFADLPSIDRFYPVIYGPNRLLAHINPRSQFREDDQIALPLLFVRDLFRALSAANRDEPIDVLRAQLSAFTLNERPALGPPAKHPHHPLDVQFQPLVVTGLYPAYLSFTHDTPGGRLEFLAHVLKAPELPTTLRELLELETALQLLTITDLRQNEWRERFGLSFMELREILKSRLAQFRSPAGR